PAGLSGGLLRRCLLVHLAAGLLRRGLLGSLAAGLLRRRLLADLAGGLLGRRLLGDLVGGLLHRRLLGDLADRRLLRRCGLLGRLLGGGALLRSFLRGHVMALLVVGLRVADYGPVLQDTAGGGPAINRRRAKRAGTDLADRKSTRLNSSHVKISYGASG